MITVTCNGEKYNGAKCQRKAELQKEDVNKIEGWMVIKIKFVYNGLQDARLISTGLTETMHFCSRQCFEDYFFKNDKK